MTKPGKIYKNPDGWAFQLALGWIIAVVVSGLAIFGLIVWGIVELVQFLVALM